MALKDDFEKTGNRLTRWKKLPVILFIPLFILEMRGYYKISPILDLAYLVISMTGLTVRFITAGFHTKHDGDSLDTTGMYSIVRNPLYFGNFMILLGFVLFPRSILLVVAYVAIFTLYYERIIYAEEASLRAKFGDEYNRWADNTPTFFPKFGKWARPENKFSFKQAVKLEYVNFFVIISMFTVLDRVSDLFIYGSFELRLFRMWFYIFLASLVIYLPIRILHKFTRFFDKE